MEEAPESTVVHMFNHPHAREEFQSMGDRDIRSVLGVYGNIARVGIYRWRASSLSSKALHLFIEFDCKESAAAAASGHTAGEGKRGINHQRTQPNNPLYKAFLGMKAQPGLAYWRSSTSLNILRQSAARTGPNANGALGQAKIESRLGHPVSVTPSTTPKSNHPHTTILPNQLSSTVTSSKPTIPLTPHDEDSGGGPLKLPLKRRLSDAPIQPEAVSLAERLDEPPGLLSQPPVKKPRFVRKKRMLDELTKQKDAIEGREVERAAKDAARVADLEKQLKQEQENASRAQEEANALKSRCELLEKQLEQVRQDHLAVSRENEKLNSEDGGRCVSCALSQGCVCADRRAAPGLAARSTC
ncbi:hypothetical protein BOTBODRAFT_388772 [Botryobasidium botryosum FD-172 SS1]|uniref:Uncharacterized protein n=1 Tax=Botryobasidium botryosum (strain FD-172 SS1) TaxID=930990 RepID=A0A067MZM4_BOTB1|nr:hypothetical protein BOTBODRAFT_388772 [Botryobasidium botryosum FD-172 SS1]